MQATTNRHVLTRAHLYSLAVNVGYHGAAALCDLDPELEAELTSTVPDYELALTHLAINMVRTGQARLPTDADLELVITAHHLGPLSATEVTVLVDDALAQLSQYANADKFLSTNSPRYVYGLPGDVAYACGPFMVACLSEPVPERARDHLHRKGMGSDCRRTLWEVSRWADNHIDDIADVVRYHIRRQFAGTDAGARLFSQPTLDDFEATLAEMLNDHATVKGALWDLELVKGLDHDRAAEVIDQVLKIRKLARQGIVHAAGNHLIDNLAGLLAGHDRPSGRQPVPATKVTPAVLAPAAALAMVLHTSNGKFIPALTQVKETFRTIMGRLPRADELAAIKAAREHLMAITDWPSPTTSNNEQHVIDLLRTLSTHVEITGVELPVPGADRRRFDIVVAIDTPDGQVTVPIEVDGAQHSSWCARFHRTDADFRDAQRADVIKQEAWAKSRSDHDGALVVIDHTALASRTRRDVLAGVLDDVLTAAAAGCDLVAIAGHQATGRALSRAWYYEPRDLTDGLQLIRGWRCASRPAKLDEPPEHQRSANTWDLAVAA